MSRLLVPASPSAAAATPVPPPLVASSGRGSPAPPPESDAARPFTVAVEGNIGSGKSTLLQYLAQEPGVHVIEEPLERWRSVHNGHNLLALLYEQPERWSFLFQSYVQLTRLQMHTDTTPCRVRFIERSLHSSRHCFIELASALGSVGGAELGVLDTFYRHLNITQPLAVDLTVYLRTTPPLVFDRMRRRMRTEELNGVSLDYLQQLHEWHERWLRPEVPQPHLLVLDADQPLAAVIDQCQQHRAELMLSDR